MERNLYKVKEKYKQIENRRDKKIRERKYEVPS